MGSVQELRPYQARALDDLRAGIRAGLRRQLLVAPTGAGKTTIAAAMVRGAWQRGIPAIAVAHRTELIDQLATRIRSHALPVGIVQSQRPGDPTAPIQVCSIATLRARKSLPPARLVIVDEAHRTEAKSYRALLERYPEAWVVGLTATPRRTDGRGLGRSYDRLVVVAQPRELVADGYLREPRIFAPSFPDLAGVRSVVGDYHQGELAELMARPGIVGDVVETWCAKSRGLRSLVFAVGVAHSHALAARFVAAGVRAVHVDGTTPADQRARAFGDLVSGAIEVLCNVGIATEGIDLPELECVVLARPTQSLTIYLQVVGRALRPHPSKRDCLVLDHAGCMLQHGHALLDRVWTLDERQPRDPARPIYTCTVCFAVADKPFRACPACGAERQSEERIIRQRRGKLVEHDGEGGALECSACGSREIEEWRPKHWPEHKRARRCHGCGAFLGAVISDTGETARSAEWRRLCEVAAAKGYARGWATHRYRALFGAPPWAHGLWRTT